MYRVFPTGGPYAPKTEQKFILRRPMLISRGAVDFDDALAFARDFLAAGQEVWEIECPGGEEISRDEVRRLIRERAEALIGRPKVL